jgi:hypothetical protein
MTPINEAGIKRMPPGKALRNYVRAQFVRRGSSLRAWCLANGVTRQYAVSCLEGMRDGPLARKLRDRIINAARGEKEEQRERYNKAALEKRIRNRVFESLFDHLDDAYRCFSGPQPRIPEIYTAFFLLACKYLEMLESPEWSLNAFDELVRDYRLNLVHEAEEYRERHRK